MANMTELLPNPDTYLNHLPPDKAAQFEVAKIVQVASLGAIVWDMFSFIPEDVKVLRQGGGLVTSICFVLTRFLAALYVTFWVVTSTHPITNCQGMMLGSNIVCFFLMAATSFLFLRRVQAVYTGNRLAYWLFALLFSCSSVTHVLPTLGIVSKHIPGTNYCATFKVELFASITYFMPGVFDTLVFFAVSYKIAYQDHQHHSSLVGNPITRFFSSKSLPILSRALLQGGQQYYLVGFIFRLASVILMFTPSVPVLYQPLALLPSVVVVSSIACRVHRLMALAYYEPEGETSRIRVSHIWFAGPRPMTEKSIPHGIPENISVKADTQVRSVSFVF